MKCTNETTRLRNENARLREILSVLDPFPCEHNVRTSAYYGRAYHKEEAKYYRKVSSGGVHHALFQHRAVLRWLILHDEIHTQPDGTNTCPVKWRQRDEWGNIMVVHHMDGERTNNQPGNLVYMPMCLNSTGVNQHTMGAARTAGKKQ